MPPSTHEVLKNIEKKQNDKEETVPEKSKLQDNQINLFTEVKK